MLSQQDPNGPITVRRCAAMPLPGTIAALQVRGCEHLDDKSYLSMRMRFTISPVKRTQKRKFAPKRRA